jgi:hypothetical protein
MKKRMPKILLWLNYLAVLMGITVILILAYGILKKLNMI